MEDMELCLYMGSFNLGFSLFFLVTECNIILYTSPVFCYRMTVIVVQGVGEFDTLSAAKPSWRTSCDSTSSICIPRLATPRSIQLSRPGSVSEPATHAIAMFSVLRILGWGCLVRFPLTRRINDPMVTESIWQPKITHFFDQYLFLHEKSIQTLTLTLI